MRAVHALGTGQVITIFSGIGGLGSADPKEREEANDIRSMLPKGSGNRKVIIAN